MKKRLIRVINERHSLRGKRFHMLVENSPISAQCKGMHKKKVVELNKTIEDNSQQQHTIAQYPSNTPASVTQTTDTGENNLHDHYLMEISQVYF